MAQTPTTLFPSIGTVADQTDNLQTRETDGSIGNTTLSTLSANDSDSEEKVVQEVESLCMQCGEQVSLIFFFFCFLWVIECLIFSVGNYPSSPYIYTLFPRSDRDVFPLRTLWNGE